MSEYDESTSNSDSNVSAEVDDGFQNAQTTNIDHSDSDGDNLQSLAGLSSPLENRPSSLPEQSQDLKFDTSTSTTKSAIIVPSILHNPYAAEPTYFTRPNRFFGPASTWRSWTEADRMVVESLDRIRTQNLSMHLYNAFGLKKHARKTAEGTKRKKRGRGRPSSRTPKTNEAIETDDIIVPRSWTAWPLPPDEVPRDELFPMLSQGGSIRRQADFRPSATLEEATIAVITKLARIRWQKRRWESKDKVLPKDEIKTSEEQQKPDEKIQEEESKTAYIDAEEGGEVFFSQAFNSESGSSADDEEPTKTKEDSDPEEEEESRRPTPLADDDRARSLLTISARHILSKLDALLLGLHKARQAYAVPKPRRMSREQEDDDDDGAMTDATTSRSRGRSRQPKSRKRARSESKMSIDSRASGARVSSLSASRNRKYRAIGLRDWSDVVGMAALTGWNPDIVQRTSERCAQLFGQNMTFRTFYEGDETAKDTESKRSFFTEHFAADYEISPEPEAAEGLTSRSQSRAPREQIHLITRTIKACTRCHDLRVRCELANTGSDQKHQICKNCLKRNEACSGMITKKVMDADKLKTRTCPYRDCARHTIPFKKTSHLQRHIETVHQNESPPFPPTSPIPLLRRMSSEILSSPHRTEIICPVPNCPRHENGFSKGSKLYAHIRQMHKDLDVEQIKKMERHRRGSRKGERSDHHRFRSRSVSMNVSTDRSGKDRGEQSGSRARRRSRSPIRDRSEDGKQSGDDENESESAID